MNPISRILALLVLGASLLAGPWVQAQQPARVIQVGVFELHPLVFLDSKGKAQGFFVDLLEEIARQENWRLEYVDGTWAEGLRRVRNDDIDLMTVIINTPERDRFLDFCQEEVMLIWGQVFAPRSAQIQSILDLDGADVAIMRDDLNGQNFVTTAANFGVNCNIILTDSHREVFQTVQSGRASAGVAPNIYGFSHAHEYGLTQTPVIFFPKPTTLGTAEGKNADLLAVIDRYLRQWKAEQGSFYYQSLERWFGLSGQTGTSLPRWIAAALVLLGFVFILLFLWNRILNRQVIARTRQLKESESKIRAIFDRSFLFIGMLDLEGNLTEINRTALEFVGVDAKDVLGKPFWEGPWWNHDPSLQNQVKRGIEKAFKGEVHFGEAVHFDAQGVAHSVEYCIKPVFDDEGNVVMLIPEGMDVSERERLARDLRQSQKIEAIGTLAGGIAHDFNNILTAISGFNDLALEDAKGQPAIEDSLKEVALATERARHLVQQILTFSRRKDSEKSVFSPAVVVEEAIKLLRSSLPSTITFETHVAADGKILADPTQIHQVVMNLGTNAYHAMEAAGGTLAIHLTDAILRQEIAARSAIIPPGEYVLLEVSDTGTGMDPVLTTKIFEPYFTSKESGKGTGLGLSVVHGIVKSTHAFMQVDSTPGKGTRFFVYFPTTDESQTAGEEPVEITSGVEGKERILFVDDEVTLTGLAARSFSALGYQIQVFDSSSGAWEAFRARPEGFDLVVTDQAMPHMTGLDLVRKIRDLRPDIPIILCSGYDAGITLEDIRELRINQLLHKPLLMRSLAREVRQIFDHPDP